MYQLLIKSLRWFCSIHAFVNTFICRVMIRYSALMKWIAFICRVLLCLLLIVFFSYFPRKLWVVDRWIELLLTHTAITYGPIEKVYQIKMLALWLVSFNFMTSTWFYDISTEVCLSASSSHKHIPRTRSWQKYHAYITDSSFHRWSA